MDMLSNTKLNIADVLLRLFNELDVKATHETVSNRLRKHPNFPSTKSICDVLSSFDIKNKATVVDIKTLENIQTPFLATTRDSQTVLIKSIDQKMVTLYSPTNGTQEQPMAVFEGIWNGLVILVDIQASYQERDYKILKRKENFQRLRKPIILFSALLAVSLVLWLSMGSLALLSYSICKIAGLVITSLLLAKGMNKNLEVKFCESGDKASCNDVLDSKAAYLFGVIPMTDIGFVYFLGSLIATCITLLSNQDVIILKILNVISLSALFYVPFSLYYQYFEVKKWCVLCLGVLSVIIFENIAAFYLYYSTTVEAISTITSLLLIVLSFLIPISLLILFKQLITKGLKYDAVFYHRSRLLNNYEIFASIQEKAKSYEMQFADYDIVLGQPDAKHTITVVINPFCSICADEYEQINELLNSNPETYNVIIRFPKSSLQQENRNRDIIEHLINLYYNEGKFRFQKILRDWFVIRHTQSFKQKYPTSPHLNTTSTLNHILAWNDHVTITRTPTVFFEDKKMSEHYSLEDLAYF